MEEDEEGWESEEVEIGRDVEPGVISNYGIADAIRGADRSDRSHSKIKGKLRGMGGRVTRRIGHFNYTRGPRVLSSLRRVRHRVLREMQDKLK